MVGAPSEGAHSIAAYVSGSEYVPSLDVYAELDLVVLNRNWVVKNYDALWRGQADASRAIEELFFVLSHEAGHQFDYHNPGGITIGCGDGVTRCHAPYYSGSVMSYDGEKGLSQNYRVTEEDIRHIPNATWNDDDSDIYRVSMLGEPSSISTWGVWIKHAFEVSGRTSGAPGPGGGPAGGNLSITDQIFGVGAVYGKPSSNVSLTTSATWSGEDNFLGVDMDPDYLGVALRADANLRYTFGNRPNLALRVNDFEAHYRGDDGIATWHDHNYSDWGDFTYNMDCTSGGCSGESAEANWYASDAGDPSGWVGGVVSDLDNEYAGSFVAEKD